MPLVECVRSGYRDFEPPNVREFDMGIADLVVRLGFGRYAQESETVETTQRGRAGIETTLRKFTRHPRG